MGEEPSLTDAVKEAAGGRSLTDAVRGVARPGAWAGEEAADADDGRAAGRGRRAAGTLAAGIVVAAISAFAALLVRETPAARPPAPALQVAERTQAPVALSRRVALVVGNSAYRHAPRLANPRFDAVDMAAALRQLGFRVIEGFDLDKRAFDAKVAELAAALAGADVGLFFYAGHGLQVRGHNYLVPVDARLDSAAALEAETVALDQVHQTMEQRAPTNLLFFDACRDNPLSRTLARALGSRSLEIGRGLAPLEGAAGTLVSFSTQPGNVALDGEGRNSPFSGALVRQLTASSEDLLAILTAVRNEVMRRTDRRQVPWEHVALTRRFYFKPVVETSALASPGHHGSSEHGVPAAGRPPEPLPP